MSAVPDNELDLEKLFLPAWAQEPAAAKKYSQYEGGEDADRPRGRDDRRGPRPPRRERGFDDRRGRDDRGRGERRPQGQRDGRPGGQAGPQPRAGEAPGGRPGRAPRFERRGPRPADDQGGGRERRRDRDRGPAPLPLPEIAVSIVPDAKGVESLARQVRMTGRAYPLFDIAQMILQRPERHSLSFSIKKNAEGQPFQTLFLCVLDDSLWLTEDEAIAHVLLKHFGTFYQAERTATEPPKGKYTFVAQCGMSGVILGPPNHHDYQNQLRKLHTERFSRMPFDAYKSRIKIVRDEEVVKKWVEEQSWKTEYTCLNMPEPLRLPTREAVEQHFRQHHKDNIIKTVEAHTLTGVASRGLRCHQLARLVRQTYDDQRRFPLQVATVLSHQFASHGLQFFKVNRTVTHVSVARPHYLDLEATPVSEGVKRIVDYINAHAKCNRRQLVETMAPTPPSAAIPVASSTEAGAEAAPPATTDGAQPSPEKAAPKSEPPGPTPEQTAVIADLHWLIHQGHVLEFANGTLETAKKPLPRPPKPEPPTQPEAGAEAPAQPATDQTALGEVSNAETQSQETQAQETAADTAPDASSTTGPTSPPPDQPAVDSVTAHLDAPPPTTETSAEKTVT